MAAFRDVDCSIKRCTSVTTSLSGPEPGSYCANNKAYRVPCLDGLKIFVIGPCKAVHRVVVLKLNPCRCTFGLKSRFPAPRPLLRLSPAFCTDRRLVHKLTNPDVSFRLPGVFFDEKVLGHSRKHYVGEHVLRLKYPRSTALRALSASGRVLRGPVRYGNLVPYHLLLNLGVRRSGEAFHTVSGSSCAPLSGPLSTVRQQGHSASPESPRSGWSA